jgi:hypothetical protein
VGVLDGGDTGLVNPGNGHVALVQPLFRRGVERAVGAAGDGMDTLLGPERTSSLCVGLLFLDQDARHGLVFHTAGAVVSGRGGGLDGCGLVVC